MSKTKQFSKEETHEYMQNKLENVMKTLEDGIRSVMTSERFRDYLKFHSSFHKYSLNNTILIYMQQPKASLVTGFKAWQKLGRSVKKGEKAIQILAPSPYETQVEKTRQNAQGKDEAYSEKVKRMGFRAVSVFDLSQTDGKELPQLCKRLEGNSQAAEIIYNTISEFSEFPISIQPIGSGANGFFNREKNVIGIREGLAMDQMAKTLVHEYSHAKLHGKDGQFDLPSNVKEVQVEAVAFMVCEHFGLDSSQYSFDYLASWSSSYSLDELKSHMNTIMKTAGDIIGRIEDHLEPEQEVIHEMEAKPSTPKLKELTTEEFEAEFMDLVSDAVQSERRELYEAVFIKRSMLVNCKREVLNNIEPALRDAAWDEGFKDLPGAEPIGLVDKTAEIIDKYSEVLKTDMIRKPPLLFRIEWSESAELFKLLKEMPLLNEDGTRFVGNVAKDDAYMTYEVLNAALESIRVPRQADFNEMLQETGPLFEIEWSESKAPANMLMSFDQAEAIFDGLHQEIMDKKAKQAETNAKTPDKEPKHIRYSKTRIKVHLPSGHEMSGPFTIGDEYYHGFADAMRQELNTEYKKNDPLIEARISQFGTTLMPATAITAITSSGTEQIVFKDLYKPLRDEMRRMHTFSACKNPVVMAEANTAIQEIVLHEYANQPKEAQAIPDQEMVR